MFLDSLSSQSLLSLLQIIWIDLLLSGDNAVVIALACRALPSHQRKAGLLLGALAAVALRILFAVVITRLIALPFLKAIASLLLLWIAIKLAAGEEDETHDVPASETLWKAVKTIAIADAVMSLDNVIAISGAAHGNIWLFVFGLLLSVPLIIAGATLILSILVRFPVLVWGGAALLAWIAGDMASTDPWIVLHFGADVMQAAKPFLSALFVVLALLAACVLRWREKKQSPVSSETANRL